MNNILMDHCLNSARGWVELGNCIEASRELDRMIPAWRTHPATLEVRWEIYARGKLWNAAFEMALAICEFAPERIDGWVLQAESLFHRNQELRSRDLLISVIDRFPGRALIPFRLACYSHHLGFTEEVKEWVELAFTCGDLISWRTGHSESLPLSRFSSKSANDVERSGGQSCLGIPVQRGESSSSRRTWGWGRRLVRGRWAVGKDALLVACRAHDPSGCFRGDASISEFSAWRFAIALAAVRFPSSDDLVPGPVREVLPGHDSRV